jgi:predicted nucleic acid-binding protein
MILVDTSVLINFMKGQTDYKTELFSILHLKNIK